MILVNVSEAIGSHERDIVIYKTDQSVQKTLFQIGTSMLSRISSFAVVFSIMIHLRMRLCALARVESGRLRGGLTHSCVHFSCNNADVDGAVPSGASIPASSMLANVMNS